MSEITATAPDTATKAKPYVCLTCTRPFARLEHLKRHERSHTKEKPFCCDQAGSIPGCGRRFARRDLLLRHQQKIHLFPNTSKRRRLSTVSQASGRSASAKTSEISEHFMIAIPQLDDLTNFENGTVNPSSIFSTSPPASSHSTSAQRFAEGGMDHLESVINPTQDFTYATEKLFPDDIDLSHGTEVQQTLWPTPDLSLNMGSPTSTISSQYSRNANYGSLGNATSLEHAGTDSELFSPDFFVASGAFMCQGLQHQHLRSQSLPQSLSQVPQSDLFLSTHLDQLTQRSSSKCGGYPNEPNTFQFAGGDQAYCNGFRPADNSTYISTNFVESF